MLMSRCSDIGFIRLGHTNIGVNKVLGKIVQKQIYDLRLVLQHGWNKNLGGKPIATEWKYSKVNQESALVSSHHSDYDQMPKSVV